MDRDWVTPTKPGKGYVSPADATPETPSWRIVGTDKSARFAFGDRSGMIRYGRCTAFQSVAELRAFAEFMEANPDFALENAYHQAAVNVQSITELPDGRIGYQTCPSGSQPAKSVTTSLEKINQYLWVSQLPLEPIPLENRNWIKNKPACLASTETTEDTDEMSETNFAPAPDAIAKNTILYGPPGTGKTYNTIVRAVGIIDGVSPETLSMGEAKPRWNALRGEDRIEFVTFHQSYGYEDFVEGICPVMTDEAGETPRYEVFEGVLKRIALRALGAMLEPALTIPRKHQPMLEMPKLSPASEAVNASLIPFETLWNRVNREIKEHPENTYEALTERTIGYGLFSGLA